MVFNCRSVSPAQYAGGIAAISEGTIDHCTSGINLSGNTSVTLPNGNKVNPAEYNSYIFGNYCGGIAAVNKGEITGSRNGAVIEGVYSGGITALNEGKIYGSANNGAVGSTSVNCRQSGGIAGENKGKIHSSYNSGKPSCGDSTAYGMVAGVNSSAAIRDVFYSDYNSVPAVGSSSSVQLSDTSGLVKNSDMKTAKFVDTLNNVTDDTVTWVRTKFQNSYFNQGFPTIRGNYLNERTIYLNKSTTLSGTMHDDLRATAAHLSEESDLYNLFAAEDEIISAFTINTTDAKGSYIPAELWTSGGLQLTVSSSSEEAKRLVLLVQNDDGTIGRIAPDSIGEGSAVFTLGEARAFATALTTSYLLGDADGNGEVDIIDASIIQRFDAEYPISPDIPEGFEARADVDGDGDITIIDATLIQRYLAGMTVRYPIGEYPALE